MKDAELKRLVAEELEWEPSLEEAGIEIAVSDDGVITLSGQVKSYYEKTVAEQCAQRVAGVTAVANEIDVLLAGIQDDTKTAEQVVRALADNIAVPDHAIQVTVERGRVKLEGSVPWDYQRRSAERVVRGISGIRGLTNLIQVVPIAEPVEIKDKIIGAFQRNALIDAEHVHVTTEGSKVVLTGAVSSWKERTEAERQAWSAPGVTSVDNRLHISSGAVVV
jgi:osmotically-inducible protein OsmY